MNVRSKLTLAVMGAALGAVLSGCAGMHKLGSVSSPAQAEAEIEPNGPLGHRIEEVTALNGPPSQQWDMPDGRKAYQWQSSSISATVAPALKGEIKSTGVSQHTCFYTLYAKPDAKGVVKVVGAEELKPGCMTLAMVGQSK